MINSGEQIKRFTFSERLIHILLFMSLIVLSITGLTLKFHASAFSQWFIRMEGGILFRGQIHRIAAVVLLAVFFWHILSIMFSRRTHEFFQDMFFTRQDLRDCRDLVKYNLGLRREMPLFDRFSCIEKIQYYAVGFAIVLLGLSGLILWFKTFFMMVTPKWTIDLVHTVHSFEATVGFLVLVVWHLYNVHLNPRVFPMQKSWLSGSISKEDLKKDHPLQYKRLYGDEK